MLVKELEFGVRSFEVAGKLKLEFSLRALFNHSLTVTHVRCVMAS